MRRALTIVSVIVTLAALLACAACARTVPEKVSQSDADKLTMHASSTGAVKMYDVYDYAPYTGNKDAIAPGGEEVRSDSGRQPKLDTMPALVASPAFYPCTAEVAESLYTQKACAASSLKSVATSKAFEKLANGDDCIVVATMPNVQQMQAIEDSGHDVRFVPVAREAIIFYARDDDGVIGGADPALSSDDIRRAYATGADANPLKLNLVALAHGNGSTTCFEEFLAGKAEALDINAQATVYPDMNSIISAAALESPSLGYAYNQFYRYSCSSPNMNLVAVDGVYPSFDIIRNGAYPVMFDVCVMYDANGPSAAKAQVLVDYLLSDEGQATLSSTGLCPLPKE